MADSLSSTHKHNYCPLHGDRRESDCDFCMKACPPNCELGVKSTQPGGAQEESRLTIFDGHLWYGDHNCCECDAFAPTFQAYLEHLQEIAIKALVECRYCDESWPINDKGLHRHPEESAFEPNFACARYFARTGASE